MGVGDGARGGGKTLVQSCRVAGFRLVSAYVNLAESICWYIWQHC